MSDRIGQQLGNYRLIRLLGQERTAEVYLGEHVRQKAFVTIKVPHMSLDAGSQESLLSEARLLTRLEHPNIERILEVDIQNMTPFLVTEYAPGGTLRNRHPRGVPLTLAQIVSYVKQLSSALQYMHEHNLIHRDVKPENMLLGVNDKVLLSDLGIAVLSHISASFSSPELSGSLAYMAPEQLQGRVREASDQYSLAIVVYEWLTGRLPFQGSFAEIVSQHLSTPPPSLRAINPTIPPDVEQVVMIALSKDPQQRFASVRALATAFEQAANLGQKTPATTTLFRPDNSPGTAQPLPLPPAPATPLPESAIDFHPGSQTLLPSSSLSFEADDYRAGSMSLETGRSSPPGYGADSSLLPTVVGSAPSMPMPSYQPREATGAMPGHSVKAADLSGAPSTSSLAKGLGSALKKITSSRKDNRQQAKELALFAIARTTVDDTNRAIVGNTYTLEAGISQSSPEGFRGESIRVRTQNAVDPLAFDILIHPGDNMELMGAWYQRLRYNPGSVEPQFITCPFRLKAPGRGQLTVHFYRERQWLKAIRFEFEGMLEPQSVAATMWR